MSDFARDADPELRRDLAVRRPFDPSTVSGSSRAASRDDGLKVAPITAERRHAQDGAEDDQLNRPAAGTLFIVATPIGNLEDITLRALRVLREVAVVAAEDTRRSGQLLRHYNIATPRVSLREHNEQQCGRQLLARLVSGESVALVSDAGTPGISDPGALFVRAVRAAGVRVEPIPGASAVSAILSASGLAFERYAFAGFPPIRSKDRKQWFEWVGSLAEVPVVCFEAPHRIERTLREVRLFLVNRPIIVARELTKLHEEWWFMSPAPPTSVPESSTPVPTSVPQSSTSVPTSTSVPARGEFSFIIAPEIAASMASRVPTDEEIGVVFGQMTEFGHAGSRREAIRATASSLALSAKQVYAALERLKSHT